MGVFFAILGKIAINVVYVSWSTYIDEVSPGAIPRGGLSGRKGLQMFNSKRKRQIAFHRGLFILTPPQQRFSAGGPHEFLKHATPDY